MRQETLFIHSWAYRGCFFFSYFALRIIHCWYCCFIEQIVWLFYTLHCKNMRVWCNTIFLFLVCFLTSSRIETFRQSNILTGSHTSFKLSIPASLIFQFFLWLLLVILDLRIDRNSWKIYLIAGRRSFLCCELLRSACIWSLRSILNTCFIVRFERICHGFLVEGWGGRS